MLDDELDERFSHDNTKHFIWDVRDLDKPVLKKRIVSEQTAVDHNQYIVGDYTYQSNYEAGLRIMHIDEAKYDLQEVAYFDVYPSSTTAKFQGSWSNYPYFKSGNVVISSIEYGLFVVRPEMNAIEAEVKRNASFGQQRRTRTLFHAKANASCPYALEDIQQCTTAKGC